MIAVIAGWFYDRGRTPALHGVRPAAHGAVGLSHRRARGSPPRWRLSPSCNLTVFGAGVYFLLRLMHDPPHPGETPPEEGAPHRSAGITPVAAVHPDRALHPRGP